MNIDIEDEFLHDGDIMGISPINNNNCAKEFVNNNTEVEAESDIHINSEEEAEVDMQINEEEEEHIVLSQDGADVHQKSSKRRSRAKKKEEREQMKTEKREKYRKAVAKLKDGKWKSINKCAQFHGVPASTLRDLYRSELDYRGPGRRLTVFTEEEEKRIVTYLRHQCKYGFGLSFFELTRLIQELAEGLKAANPERKFPEAWAKLLPKQSFVYNFARRHLLSLHSTMELSKARSIVTREDLELWQNDTEGGLVFHPDFAECWADPRRIFNQACHFVFLD